MATKLCRSRAFASALRPTRQSPPSPSASTAAPLLRNEQRCCIASTARQNVAMPKDVTNMRHAPRDHPKELKVPIVNPADKYATKAEDLHRYGAWLMGCMPKYIQQFSVWKDELVIYISPAGVIPVFSFLKRKKQPSLLHGCVMPPAPRKKHHDTDIATAKTQTTQRPSSPRLAASRPWTSRPRTSASRSCTTC